MPERRPRSIVLNARISGRKREVFDWKVLYRDGLDQDRTYRSGPSEEAALERARQLYLKERLRSIESKGRTG
jgi:hypothetical protein